MRAGIISDTHGLMRQEALDALMGSDLIIHAGDIGQTVVLDELQTIAPVIAVKGNVDRAEWADTLPFSRVIEIESVRLYIIHDIQELNINPAAESVDMVISGHSHIPRITETDGVVFLNPGSAGPRRFSLPISVATVQITGRRIQARMVHLS